MINPGKILKIIAKEQNKDKRSVDTPTKSQLRKYRTKHLLAKLRLASHPTAKAKVLHKLAENDLPELLERVAENPQTHAQTLEKLATHDESAVRSAVAENKNTPLEQLKSLASDESADVRFKLAENYQTPVEILRILVNDENPYVSHRAKQTLKNLQSK